MTQGFIFTAFGGLSNEDDQTLGGTIDLTGVENYPTFPDLVGTLTIGSVGGSPILPSDPLASELKQFVADFPVGSIWSIDVQLVDKI
jgi:hypothetical protein